MAKGATSKSNHFLNMSLLILLSYLRATLPDGTVFLRCNFIVKYRSLHGQCSVNGKSLLHFGDGKQEGNATELCPDLLQSLEETLGGMWSLQSGNGTLNVTLKSQYNQGEFIDGRWAINIDEKYSIYFYPFNMTWRESHSDVSGAMEQWKNNKELEIGLSKVLMKHFNDCLKKLLPHSREMPRSTMKELDTTQPIYGLHIHPTANITQIMFGTQNQPTANIMQHKSGIQNEPTLNITQNNSYTQSLSITWKVILCIGGPIIIIIIFLFSWCRMKKKKKVLSAAPLPLQTSSPAIIG